MLWLTLESLAIIIAFRSDHKIVRVSVSTRDFICCLTEIREIGWFCWPLGRGWTPIIHRLFFESLSVWKCFQIQGQERVFVKKKLVDRNELLYLNVENKFSFFILCVLLRNELKTFGVCSWNELCVSVFNLHLNKY